MFGRKLKKFFIKDEVKWGAAVLDQAIPGWYNHIDLDQLDMMSMTKCVFGQLGNLPEVKAYVARRYGSWTASEYYQFTNTQNYVMAQTGELLTVYSALLGPLGRGSWVNAIKERRAVDAEQAKCRELAARDLKIVEVKVEYDLAA